MSLPHGSDFDQNQRAEFGRFNVELGAGSAEGMGPARGPEAAPTPDVLTQANVKELTEMGKGLTSLYAQGKTVHQEPPGVPGLPPPMVTGTAPGALKSPLPTKDEYEAGKKELLGLLPPEVQTTFLQLITNIQARRGVGSAQSGQGAPQASEGAATPPPSDSDPDALSLAVFLSVCGDAFTDSRKMISDIEESEMQVSRTVQQMKYDTMQSTFEQNRDLVKQMQDAVKQAEQSKVGGLIGLIVSTVVSVLIAAIVTIGTLGAAAEIGVGLVVSVTITVVCCALTVGLSVADYATGGAISQGFQTMIEDLGKVVHSKVLADILVAVVVITAVVILLVASKGTASTEVAESMADMLGSEAAVAAVKMSVQACAMNLIMMVAADTNCFGDMIAELLKKLKVPDDAAEMAGAIVSALLMIASMIFVSTYAAKTVFQSVEDNVAKGVAIATTASQIVGAGGMAVSSGIKGSAEIQQAMIEQVEGDIRAEIEKLQNGLMKQLDAETQTVQDALNQLVQMMGATNSQAGKLFSTLGGMAAAVTGAPAA